MLTWYIHYIQYTVVNTMDVIDDGPLFHSTCTLLFPPHYLGILHGVTLLDVDVVHVFPRLEQPLCNIYKASKTTG